MRNAKVGPYYVLDRDFCFVIFSVSFLIIFYSVIVIYNICVLYTQHKEDKACINHFFCNTVCISDEEDLFSVKHVAASRFHRNQKLMADIFSDIVVPDLRTG